METSTALYTVMWVNTAVAWIGMFFSIWIDIVCAFVCVGCLIPLMIASLIGKPEWMIEKNEDPRDKGIHLNLVLQFHAATSFIFTYVAFFVCTLVFMRRGNHLKIDVYHAY